MIEKQFYEVLQLQNVEAYLYGNYTCIWMEF